MSNLIPKSFIVDILQQCQLIELIDNYVPLKKQGHNYIACCPFHNEKTPSFNVIAKKQFYYCFGCGAHGNAISFIMQYLEKDFVDAVNILATNLGIAVPIETNSNKIVQHDNLYKILEMVCKFYENTLKKNGVIAIDYLKQRGINGTIAKKYKLGYAPAGRYGLDNLLKQYRQELIASGMLVCNDQNKTYNRYQDRIMFPIYNCAGKIIGFGGRSINQNQQPKYLNSPETVLFQKKRELYGLYQALQINNKPEQILVVEGYIDVISLAQYEIYNVVATLGTSFNIYHLQILHKYTNKIVFCFDGDNAGRDASWRALETSLPYLNYDLELRFMFLPDNYDPDNLIRQEGRKLFTQRIEKSISLSDFLLTKLTKDINLNTISGKNKLLNLIKLYLLRIPEGGFRQLLLSEITRLTHIEGYRVETLMNLSNKKNIQLRYNEYQKSLAANSPIKLAIAILLQNPEIYYQCQVACEAYANLKLANTDDKEQIILQQLIQQIGQMIKPTTAILIEIWRNNAFFDLLAKLIVWEHQIAFNIITEEFIGILNFLQKQNLEYIINSYLVKSRKCGLTASDKVMLQDLLKRRHKNILDNT